MASPCAAVSISISPSISVNCENTNTRRPSATSFGQHLAQQRHLRALHSSAASPCPHQPRVRSIPGAASAAHRGSRSASRRSSCACSTRRTLLVGPPGARSRTAPAVRLRAARGGSPRSWAAARPPRPPCAGAGLNGRTRCASNCARSVSPLASIGRRHCRAKVRASPRKPGINRSKCAQSSPRWFSSGVPVTHRRCRTSSRRSAPAARLPAFLTICASSRISRCQGCCRSGSMSRHSSG